MMYIKIDLFFIFPLSITNLSLISIVDSKEEFFPTKLWNSDTLYCSADDDDNS